MSTQTPFDMGSSQSEESGAKAPTHIDYKLENIIAEALDNAGVPNVFCGHGLMSVYGLLQEQKVAYFSPTPIKLVCDRS